jgi:hypothetical protein
VFSASGTPVTGWHIVTGTGSTGTAVTLSGSAQFSSATSYTCFASDTDASANPIVFSYASGSQFTAAATNGPGGQAFRFVCQGN